MSYCEIICDQCKLSLALPGPFARAIHDDIYITACRHLFHFGCLYRLYINSTTRTEQGAQCVPCPHPSCKQMILGSDSFFVDQSLRIFQVLNTDSRVQSLVNQLALQRDYITRIEMVMINENIELKNQLEEYRREHFNLMTRYNLLLDHQIGNLFSNIRPRINSSNNPQPSSSQTASVMPQSSTSNSDVPQFTSPPPLWRQFQNSAQPLFAKPQASCDSALIQRPEPVETPIPTIVTPRQQTVHAGSLTQPIISQLKYVDVVGTPSTSSDSSRASGSGISTTSDRVAPTTLRSKIFPPKPKKGTSADKRLFHKNYRARFGSDSAEIEPFYPINSYPHGFTAAGYEILDDAYIIVFLAYNILIMGDGHADGIARYLSVSKPYENLVDIEMYRRDLLASELLLYLETFLKLPKRIMMSIGNFDIQRGTSYGQFFNIFQAIILLFKKLKVQELIILPLIPHKKVNQEQFSEINRALNYDWERTLGARITRIPHIFEEFHTDRAGIDQYGPFYPSNQYANVLLALRNELIPDVLPRHSTSQSPRPPTPDVEIPPNNILPLLPLDLRIPRICLTPVKIDPPPTTTSSTKLSQTTTLSTPSTSSCSSRTDLVVQSVQISTEKNANNLGKKGKPRRVERRKREEEESLVRNVRRRTDPIVRMVEEAIEQVEKTSMPPVNVPRDRAARMFASDSRSSLNDHRTPSRDDEIKKEEAEKETNLSGQNQ
ncbi:unnamed protein product [Allacma fusca]|uniref:RING-type domain-containing protein n=1 Tax=Allacma fusca TaxID=39272 RepID=A0A8J2L1Q8_9HEXA|nr:unnamed protein product [Allacma fusca]